VSARGDHDGPPPDKVAFVNIDIMTDPLTWPLPADAPSTDDAWETEWRVFVERMRGEPDNPWTIRFRLHELTTDPPTDFKRRFLTVWYVASDQSPQPGIRPKGPAYEGLVTRLDQLVSGERTRQVRWRLEDERRRLTALAEAGDAADELTTLQRGAIAVEPGDLPGGLTWFEIDSAYRRLAAEAPGLRNRRRRPDEPSRPEVAAAVHRSPATLKRACEAAGEGSRWPPIRLRPR